mmetsp:Transcript_45022/g.86061  ORF Transcript_45022/g.86061 Transcript_45022/m.86061 type:complete len:353 (-) Transcript_45022:613-1671(-)
MGGCIRRVEPRLCDGAGVSSQRDVPGKAADPKRDVRRRGPGARERVLGGTLVLAGPVSVLRVQRQLPGPRGYPPHQPVHGLRDGPHHAAPNAAGATHRGPGAGDPPQPVPRDVHGLVLGIEPELHHLLRHRSRVSEVRRRGDMGHRRTGRVRDGDDPRQILDLRHEAKEIAGVVGVRAVPLSSACHRVPPRRRAPQRFLPAVPGGGPVEVWFPRDVHVLVAVPQAWVPAERGRGFASAQRRRHGAAPLQRGLPDLLHVRGGDSSGTCGAYRDSPHDRPALGRAHQVLVVPRLQCSHADGGGIVRVGDVCFVRGAVLARRHCAARRRHDALGALGVHGGSAASIRRSSGGSSD